MSERELKCQLLVDELHSAFGDRWFRSAEVTNAPHWDQFTLRFAVERGLMERRPFDRRRFEWRVVAPSEAEQVAGAGA